MGWRANLRGAVYRTVLNDLRPAPDWRHPNEHFEVLVHFACPNGHTFDVPFDDRPGARDLGGERCPECRRRAKWRSMDYHIENAD